MSATTPSRLTRPELKVVAIVTMLLLMGLLGTDIHLSALPEMMHVMHTTQSLMQSSISVFLFGVGLSALVYGPLSDMFGRKPVVLTGLAIAIAGNLLGASLSDIGPFLGARFIQGVGSGVCLALSRIVLSDIVQGAICDHELLHHFVYWSVDRARACHRQFHTDVVWLAGELHHLGNPARGHADGVRLSVSRNERVSEQGHSHT